MKPFVKYGYPLSILLMYILLSSVIVSCEDKIGKIDDSNVQEIDLSNLDKLKRELLPVQDVKYIILETKPNCLIGEVSEVFIDDNKIFIFDKRYAKALFIFTLDGNFIRKVGRSGNGPTEYQNLNNVDIDCLKNIFIHDQRRRQFLNFDYSGQFVRSYPYDFTCSQVRHINEDLLVFFRGNHAGYSKLRTFGDNTCLFFSKSRNSIITGYFPYLGENVEVFGGASRIYRSNQNIYYIPPYEENVYCIDEKGVHQKYEIILGQNRLPQDKFNQLSKKEVMKFKRNEDLFEVSNFFENNKFAVFVLMAFKQKVKLFCLKNKINGNITISPTINKDESLNSIFLGEFIPMGVYGDSFISVIEGNPLESYIRQAKERNKHFYNYYGNLPILDELKELNSGSNPVIALVRFEN